jgi:hypothetical protein
MPATAALPFDVQAHHACLATTTSKQAAGTLPSLSGHMAEAPDPKQTTTFLWSQYHTVRQQALDKTVLL